MIKYFIPINISSEIHCEIQELETDNDCLFGKALHVLDRLGLTTGTDSEKDLINKIIKLKTSPNEERYSYEVDLAAKELLKVFEFLEDSEGEIIEISEESKFLLVKAIKSCFNRHKLFIDDYESHRYKITPGALDMYMRYRSYEFITRIDNDTDLDSIKKSLDEMYSRISPIE